MEGEAQARGFAGKSWLGTSGFIRPQRPRWITGEWASHYLTGGHRAAGCACPHCKPVSQPCPRRGVEVRMEETVAAGLHLSAPSFPSPQRDRLGTF